MSGEASIRVNGEDRRVAEGGSLGAFVRALNLAPQRLLVEYNGEPLPRDRWDATALRDGDRLELFHVAAGG